MCMVFVRLYMCKCEVTKGKSIDLDQIRTEIRAADSIDRRDHGWVRRSRSRARRRARAVRAVKEKTRGKATLDFGSKRARPPSPPEAFDHLRRCAPHGGGGSAPLWAPLPYGTILY